MARRGSVELWDDPFALSCDPEPEDVEVCAVVGGAGVGATAAAVLAAAHSRVWLRQAAAPVAGGDGGGPRYRLVASVPAVRALPPTPSCAAQQRRSRPGRGRVGRPPSGLSSSSSSSSGDEVDCDDGGAGNLLPPPSCAPSVSLQWLRPPRCCLVLLKPGGCSATDDAFRLVRAMLQRAACSVYVQPWVAQRLDGHDDEGGDALRTWPPQRAHPLAPPHGADGARPGSLDLCVTLGGDGALLHLSRLLGEGPVPPVVCIGTGTLCFTAPFARGPDGVGAALRTALGEGAQLLLRHRLAARLVCGGGGGGTPAAAAGQLLAAAASSAPRPPPRPPRARCALNEVAIERCRDGGRACRLEVSVDGRRLATLTGDGLILATATGSSAHALAAGGPLLHPAAEVLLFCPLAAHTLAARPLVLPGSAQVVVTLPPTAPASVWATFDGHGRAELRPGDALHVTLSRWPLPAVCAADATTDWAASVATNLMYGCRRV